MTIQKQPADVEMETLPFAVASGHLNDTSIGSTRRWKMEAKRSIATDLCGRV